MGLILPKYGWNEWLCHTNFSFLIGASHPHEYLERALALGYRDLGVTDFNGVYGLARTHLDRRRIVAGDDLCTSERREAENKLQLFHGCEFNLATDHNRPLLLQDTLAVFALSSTGYAHLCALSTFAHRDGKNDANVPLENFLKHDVADMVAIQPMRGMIRWPEFQKKPELLKHRLAALRDHFCGRFYLAISRHLNPSEDAWIAPTLALARALNIKVLLTQDPFFHAAQQKDISDLLHAIRTNRSVDSAVHHMFVNSERCLHHLAGIEQRFRDLPCYEDALRNSLLLAEQFHFSLDELRYHYPKEMIPNSFSPHSYLEKLVWEGAKNRFGSPIPERMVNLLTRELELIEKLNFADYFLTVWDIVRWARSQDILCQGRGSAANSAVCFVLGITSVDPSLFDLLFERFVSVERGDPPDIDVDFEHERREEVIQYIYERYGRDKAAMVANVITYRSKGALRATGKALGIPEKHLGNVSKLLSTKHFRRSGAENVLDHLKVKMLEEPKDIELEELSSEFLDTVPWQLWSDLAERLKGFPRHLGIHSGGFMLADKSLNCLVPQEPATMEGRTVIQWCKDDIEGLGFFKIDVLSLGMLTAIRKCFQMLQAHHQVDLSIASIPQDDEPTYAMIQRAATVGTFQVESRAQMSMLPRLRPKNFYDMVVEVAIIRPGPIQGGMIHPYLRRRDGKEPVTFPDERLRSILARTLGIPIFQEQVMRIAMAVGDFTAGEANELRKKMGAWNMKGDLGPWMTRLADGMRRNGLKEEFIQQLLGQLKGFADYGFPESHAVSFGLLAYVSCYLKCHFPSAFFTAILNSQPMGFYSPHALVSAACREGVKVLPICINRSDWDHKLEDISAPGKPAVFAIRLGFRVVTALREPSIIEVIKHREQVGGAFNDIEHFLQVVSIFRNDLTSLAAANAFAIFGLDRRAALWLAEAAPFCPVLEDIEDEIAWRPETAMERIEQDFAAASTTVGPHPVSVVMEEHWCYEVPIKKIIKAEDIETLPSDQVIETFGMILIRQAPPSAKGMVFFTLEDETGFINLAFTPQVYERLHELVESQSFLCVRARVQRNNESHSLLVRQVYAPKFDRAKVITLQEGEPAKEIDLSRDWKAGPKRLTKSRNYM
jgi:error-prone DNA polymerase